MPKRKVYRSTEYRVRTTSGVEIGPFTSKRLAHNARAAYLRAWRSGAGHADKYHFLSGKHDLYKNGQKLMTLWIEVKRG